MLWFHTNYYRELNLLIIRAIIIFFFSNTYNLEWQQTRPRMNIVWIVWKGFLESIIDWEFHVNNYRHLLLHRCIEFIWLGLFKHVRATSYSLHYSLATKLIRFFLCILKWDFNGFWIWNIANWTVLMHEVLNRASINLFIWSTNIKTYAFTKNK